MLPQHVYKKTHTHMHAHAHAHAQIIIFEVARSSKFFNCFFEHSKLRFGIKI